MPLSGKYDFQGIKKAGAAGLKVALASTTWGAALVKGPFHGTVNLLLEFVANWMANKGLVVFNLGAIIVNGKLDQFSFDKALEEGLNKVELGRDKISAEQGAQIDNAVIDAARKFIRFNP